MAPILGLSSLRPLQGLWDTSLQEVAPSNVLNHFQVVLVMRECSLIAPQSLLMIPVLFIEYPYLEKGVDLALQCECVRQNRVLEVANRLLYLLSLGEDHSKLVEHL